MACLLLCRKKSTIIFGSALTQPPLSPLRGTGVCPSPRQALRGCWAGDFLLRPTKCSTTWIQCSIPASQIIFPASRPGSEPQPAQCAALVSPIRGQTTLSQGAAPVAFPAFPGVPHSLSKLGKSPVRLSWKHSFSFSLEISAVFSTTTKKPQSDGFQVKSVPCSSLPQRSLVVHCSSPGAAVPWMDVP